MQPATGLLVSGTTSGRPASRRQRRKSLSRRAGDETAVAEPHWTTHVLVKKTAASGSRRTAKLTGQKCGPASRLRLAHCCFGNCRRRGAIFHPETMEIATNTNLSKKVLTSI